MSSLKKSRKTRLQRQRPERLALAIACPTFDLAYARERWRAAQLDSPFASLPQASLYPSLPTLAAVWAGRG